MISVFLPVEDYYLNYESKVENSFVNAIAPQKKFVPPPTKSPDCSCSHPRRSPSKASAYLPASPPSYPEESSQSLHAKKRISPPPHFYPRQKKTPLYAPASPPANAPTRHSTPPLPPHKEAYPSTSTIHPQTAPIPLPLIPFKTNKTSEETTRLSTHRQIPPFPECVLPIYEPIPSPPSAPPKTTLRQVAPKTYCRSSLRPTVGRRDDLPWIPFYPSREPPPKPPRRSKNQAPQEAPVATRRDWSRYLEIPAIAP